MKRIAVLVAAAAVVMGMFPAQAAEQKLTLHPRGFGEHTYSSWKAQEGLPDTNGNADQALYFQKMTSTVTEVAAIAVVQGIDGMPYDDLTALEWEHRDDGHCGGGAPRWNIVVENPSVPGSRQTLFIGCGTMAHSPGSGDDWTRDTATLPVLADGFVIRSLAIVYDEGVEFAPGYVYLDNIKVNDKVWTSASDNGR